MKEIILLENKKVENYVGNKNSVVIGDAIYL
jgi:hypothetical protein